MAIEKPLDGGSEPPTKIPPQLGTNRPPPKPPAPKEPAAGITWPTPSKRLTSVFGAHHGIDIDGQSGDPIIAPVSGQVVFAGDASDSGYGGLVIIQDASGRKHYLSHLRRIDVAEGETIDVGSFLGEMGGGANDPMQGNSTGSHLHYEIRLGSGQMDPLQLFGNVPGEYGGVTIAPPPAANSYTGPLGPGSGSGQPHPLPEMIVPEEEEREPGKTNPIANALGIDPDDPLGLKRIDWGRIALAVLGIGLIVVGVLSLVGEEAIGAAASKLAKPIAKAISPGEA